MKTQIQNHIGFYLTVLYSTYPFFYSHSSIYVIAFILLLLTSISLNRFKVGAVCSKQNILLSLPWLLIAAKILLSSEWEYMSKSLEIIALITYPFVVLPLTPKQKSICVHTFLIASLFLCFSSLATLFNTIESHNYNWHLVRSHLEKALSIHGTYACLFLALSSIIALHYAFTTTKNRVRLFYLGALLLYMVSLYLFNSRIIQMATLLLLLFIGYRKGFSKRSLPFHFAFLGISLVVISLVFSYHPRFIELKERILNKEYYSDTRYGLWHCSVSLIGENSVFGVRDIASLQEQLNSCYTDRNLNITMDSNLNTHNQYLDVLLKGGVITFIAFLGSLVILVKKGMQKKTKMYLHLILLFTIVFITENVLVRQVGVFMFIWCHILFFSTGSKAIAAKK